MSYVGSVIGKSEQVLHRAKLSMSSYSHTCQLNRPHTLLGGPMKPLSTVAIIIAVGLTACAAPSQVMVRQSDGATVRCASSGWGWLGTPTAFVSTHSCVSDFRSMGYVTIDEYQAAKNSGSAPGSVSPAPSQKPNQPLLIVNNEGGYSLSLGSEWAPGQKPDNLKNTPNATFVWNASKELFLIVSSESALDIDFGKYSAAKVAEMSAKVSNPTVSKVEKISINGFDAYRFDMSASLPNGLQAHYLYTLIKMNNKIVKLSSWTRESIFNASRAELEKLPYAVKAL